MNFLLILIIIVLTTIIFFKNNKKKNSNIPGPIGLPIFGNLLSLKGEAHLKFQKLYKKYGPIYRIRMGSIETVVLTEYSIIKEAFIGNSDIFENRFQRESRKKRNNCENLVMSNGELHKKLKSIILSEMTTVKIKNIGNEIINNEILKLFKELDNLAEIGEPIILNRYIKLISMNIILTFTYGDKSLYKYNEIEIFEDYLKILSNYINLSGQPLLSDYIPFLKLFSKNEIFDDHNKFFTSDSNRFIEKFKSENNNNNNNNNDNLEKTNKTENKPIISKLLSLYEKGEISWESVIGSCIDLQAAGTDTSANTIMFCLIELTNLKNIQNKVYNEIKQVIKKQNNNNNNEDEDGSSIQYNKYRNLLPYFSMVIKEAFRKHPVATITAHVTSNDIEFRGYKISKGTQIIQNIWATHRNEKIYQSPDSFIPERFLEELPNSNLVHFGTGVRDCMGKSLAESQIFTILASLINRYEFINPNPSIPLNEIGKFGLAYSCPENKIIIKKRV
ncbi:hypothetical protein ACTFIY_000975 [Dictyostelium cf. discoideum]